MGFRGCFAVGILARWGDHGLWIWAAVVGRMVSSWCHIWIFSIFGWWGVVLHGWLFPAIVGGNDLQTYFNGICSRAFGSIQRSDGGLFCGHVPSTSVSAHTLRCGTQTIAHRAAFIVLDRFVAFWHVRMDSLRHTFVFGTFVRDALQYSMFVLQTLLWAGDCLICWQFRLRKYEHVNMPISTFWFDNVCIHEVHDGSLQRAFRHHHECASDGSDMRRFPTVFPIQNATRLTLSIGMVCGIVFGIVACHPLMGAPVCEFACYARSQCVRNFIGQHQRMLKAFLLFGCGFPRVWWSFHGVVGMQDDVVTTHLCLCMLFRGCFGHTVRFRSTLRMITTHLCSIPTFQHFLGQVVHRHIEKKEHFVVVKKARMGFFRACYKLVSVVSRFGRHRFVHRQFHKCRCPVTVWFQQQLFTPSPPRRKHLIPQ